MSGAEADRGERARFLCAVALEDDAFEATEKDVIGYYEITRNPREQDRGVKLT